MPFVAIWSKAISSPPGEIDRGNELSEAKRPPDTGRPFLLAPAGLTGAAGKVFLTT
jgi:hypothetical protein